MQIALWKRIVIWGLCALALFYASPNLFYSRVERHNDAVLKIAKTGETPELAADRAGWPAWAPSDIVNLGLDLRGGAHLLAEVQVADVYKARMNGLWPELRKALTAERAAVGGVRRALSGRGWASTSRSIARPRPMAISAARPKAISSPGKRPTWSPL